MTELPPEFALPTDAFERQRSLLSAHVGRTRHKSRRRTGFALAFVILALLGAAIVSPAWSIGARFIDLVWSPSAPPAVQASFASNDVLRQQLLTFAKEAGATLRDRFSPVISERARGVIAIGSVDGPLYLWAAPTADGRECWMIQAGTERSTKRPYGMQACDQTGRSDEFLPSVWWTAELPNVKIVSARVYDDSISRVDVKTVSGATVQLRVVAGYALGTLARKERPLSFVARQANGEIVEKVKLRPGSSG